MTPSGKTIKAYPSPSGGIQEKPAHKARLIFFNELADATKPYAATHANLSRFMTLNDRMNSLYYQEVLDRLPQEEYTGSFAAGLLAAVHQFAREVWQEIR